MRAFRADFSKAASRLAQIALSARHLTGKACVVLTLFLGGLMAGLLAPAANAFTYLTVTVESPTKVKSVTVGENVTFRIHAANLFGYTYPSDAEAVPAQVGWLTVWLPLHSTFVSFSQTNPGSGPDWNCNWQPGTGAPTRPLPPVGSVGGTMSCGNRNPFMPGTISEFYLTVQATDAGTILGQAELAEELPAGSGNLTATANLTIAVRNGPPTVSSISPNTGPATPQSGVQVLPTTVTITGTGFTGATSVTIGGTPLGSLSVTSSTTITGTIAPANSPGPASVVVTTPLGSNPPNSLYTFVSSP